MLPPLIAIIQNVYQICMQSQADMQRLESEYGLLESVLPDILMRNLTGNPKVTLYALKTIESICSMIQQLDVSI
jgi:hypothetical protein